MAVYTTLTASEIQSLLARFNLPGLHDFHGSPAGIENTTYFITLDSGAEFVLTVFETHTAAALAPYIQLMSLLCHHNLPVPSPCIDRHGDALQIIASKPALLFQRSPGTHIDRPTPAVCRAVGYVLASIHSVTLTCLSVFSGLSNPCGLSWMQETLSLVQSSLDQADVAILQNQIHLSADLETRRLPRGIIHGDLFRDNVLVHNDNITAVIDFYNAGEDILLMDLAITANDWCYAQPGIKNGEQNINALLSGYHLCRPLSAPELDSWRECIQVAAARLWLSRQKRLVLSQGGHKGAVKDPGEYKKLLLAHLSAPQGAHK